MSWLLHSTCSLYVVLEIRKCCQTYGEPTVLYSKYHFKLHMKHVVLYEERINLRSSILKALQTAFKMVQSRQVSGE